MPLYILYGSESLARKEAFDRLRRELDTDGALATNTVTLDAATSSPQEVMSACDTVPFLGDRRLVVVTGVLTSAGKSKRARKKPAEDEEPPSPWLALVDYVDRMPDTTTLVLIDDGAPATGLLKDLGPKGEVQSFLPVGEKQLPTWVMDRARQMRLKIHPPAAHLLAELIGSSSESRSKTQSHMGLLASELDKLAAYANGEVIREADVRELVSRAKEHKGWELSDAVIEGRPAQAVRVLQELIDDGAVPAPLLSTIAGRYRRIAVVKDLLEAGGSRATIASDLNMKLNYGVDKLIEQAEAHSWDDIRAAYTRLIQADLDLKRGITEDDRLALELAVQDLASRKSRRSAARAR